MDFTPDLFGLQGVLISADNVCSFSKLTARGGNEDDIEYVIENSTQYLEQLNCISKDGLKEESIEITRKLALYIILNTDLNTLQDLVSTDGIDTVIWTVPTIPKCLMCELLWRLHMSNFVYEIIVFSYPPLSLEVVESFVNNLKYLSPTEYLCKLQILTVASYRLLYRLNFFKTQLLNNCLTILFNNFQKLINYFIEPPNSEKLYSLKRDDQYKFIGNRLHTMLNLLQQCFGQYTKREEFQSDDFKELYKLTYDDSLKEETQWFDVKESSVKAILECLDKCNTLLLDKCTEIVMDVSVDIFCAWSEFEENGKSMQQTIGEECHRLCTKLSSINSVSEHRLITMMKQISRKPEELEDIINTTDTNIIIETINKNQEDKAVWIRALLHRNQLGTEISLLHALHDNLSLLNEEESHKLYQILKPYLNDNTENLELIEMLCVKTFQYCNTNMKYEILDKRFKDGFVDMLETIESNNMTTQIFNKLIISPETDLSIILGVFLQSPQRVYTKIFSLAVENAHQADIMLEVMKLLTKYSNHYYTSDTEPCIIRITVNSFDNEIDSEAKQNNLVKFIHGLKNIGVIPGIKLLLLVMMPNLHKAIVNKNLPCINILCTLLAKAFEYHEISQYRAPLLAMLAQVIDKVRWKIDNFVVSAPSTLQLALDTQGSLMFSYHGEIPENEGKWLRNKLKNIQPHNMYYYRELWNPPGHTYVEIISGKRIHKDMDIDELMSCLSQLLPFSTPSEWYDIWDSLQVFGDMMTLELFRKAICVLMVIEKKKRTECSAACILYCFRNFILIIRLKFFKEPLTDKQVLIALQNIISIVNLFEDYIEDSMASLLPLLAYLSERKNDFDMQVFETIQSRLRVPEVLVNKLFAIQNEKH